MKWFKKRKLKNHMKSINWDALEELDENYKNGGEYMALKWLKAYVENRAGCDPSVLFDSVLRNISAGIGDQRHNGLYVMTLRPYI